VCCKFKTLHDSFVWGLAGVYGPNDDRARGAPFEELGTFISSWDIPWCLGGDFNVVRFPSQRSNEGRLTFAMTDFLNFIDSYNLIDLPLEGGCFTWTSHEEMPVLSRIDRFLFTCDWEDHFQGMHQVLLPKITSDHFLIMLQGRDVASVKRPFKFENMWLEVDGFCEVVSSFWGEIRVSGSSSFVLTKKLLFLKRRLKEWNKEVFGHLESKLAELVVKIKSFDEKEQQLFL